jgi:hypothetical protein
MSELVRRLQPLLDTDEPVPDQEAVMLNSLATTLERQVSQLTLELKEMQSTSLTHSISESESSSVSQFDIDSATSMCCWLATQS